jgi:hypothetical protein
VEFTSCFLAKANPAAGFSCRSDIARAFPLVVFGAVPVAASSSVARLRFSHSFFRGRAAHDPRLVLIRVVRLPARFHNGALTAYDSGFRSSARL